jgi:hypothetical protein
MLKLVMLAGLMLLIVIVAAVPKADIPRRRPDHFQSAGRKFHCDLGHSDLLLPALS